MEAIRPVILLIENDERDVALFRSVLSQLSFAGTLRVATSIGEARSYLEGAEPFHDRRHNPIPNLIVSDMNLSGHTGNEFLEWIRSDGNLASIPFVFFTGSFRPSDQVKSSELGAGAFFVKTGDMDVMRDRVRSMLKFLPLR